VEDQYWSLLALLLLWLLQLLLLWLMMMATSKMGGRQLLLPLLFQPKGWPALWWWS
jgi:hypothetical protein